MRKKRVLALVLAAAAAMSLTACGNSNAEENSGQSKESEQADEAEETDEAEQNNEAEATYDPYGRYEETVKITLGNLIDTTEQSNGDTYNDNVYWDYIKDTLNIEMEYELEAAAQEDYDTALSLAMTSGELPDVFGVYDYAMFVELVDAGLICDLTELYENYASDYVKDNYYGAYEENYALNKVTLDGKLYALPRSTYEFGFEVQIRQDWLDQLNITLDEDGDGLITREEIEMVAKEFVENDPGNSGNPVGFVALDSGSSSFDNTSNIVNYSFGAKAGWWYQDEDGSWVNGFTVPEMKDALAWWADMYDKGLLDEQYGVTQYDEARAMAVNGQLGIVFAAFHAQDWFYNDLYTADSNADWVYYGLDNGSGTVSYAKSDDANRYLVVSKDCENPEAAIKLVNSFLDLYAGNLNTAEIQESYPELYDMYASANHEGNPETVSPVRLAPGLITAPSTRVNETDEYLAGTRTADEVTDARAKLYVEGIDDMAAGTDEAKDRMYVDQYEGFKAWLTLKDNGKLEADSHPVQITTDVTSLYESDLKTLVSEMMIKIITGEESIDYFDTFVEEFYSRGGDEIANEYAAWFD